MECTWLTVWAWDGLRREEDFEFWKKKEKKHSNPRPRGRLFADWLDHTQGAAPSLRKKKVSI